MPSTRKGGESKSADSEGDCRGNHRCHRLIHLLNFVKTNIFVTSQNGPVPGFAVSRPYALFGDCGRTQDRDPLKFTATSGLVLANFA